MNHLLAILCGVLAFSWAPVFAKKGKSQEVWDSLKRTKDQGSFLPGSGIQLSLNVSLISLSNYDDETSTVSAYYWVVMIWKDPTIKWNAKKRGVETLRIPASKLWTPDIVPYSFKSHKLNFNTYTVVSSDGTVIYVPAYSTRITCKDAKPKNTTTSDKGPTKAKKCQLKLGSWVFDGNSLNISSYNTDVSYLNTSPLTSSGWKLSTLKKKFKITYYPCCKEPYQSYTLTFNLKQLPKSTGESVTEEQMGSWIEEEAEEEEPEDD